jgi:hypothetical protein
LLLPQLLCKYGLGWQYLGFHEPTDITQSIR